MEVVLQQLVNGILRGGTYSLVGTGFAVTYGISRILNFAHGVFFIIGSYGVYALHDSFGLPLPIAYALGPVCVAPVALVVYSAVIKPFGEGSQAALLGTFAVAIGLLEGLRLMFGGRALLLPRLVSADPVGVGEVFVGVDTVVVFGISVVVLVAAIITLNRSGTGRRLRAIVQGREAARLIGIDPEPYERFSFVAGALLAASAGAGVALLAPIIGTSGIRMTFVSFVIVVVAGLGNVTGAAVMGFVLAIAEAMSALYISADFSIAAPFVLMILVLIVRPSGLFPRKA